MLTNRGEKGEMEEVDNKGRARMGKRSNSFKLTTLLLLVSVASVAGKPILIFYDTGDDDWIFAQGM